MDVDKAIQFLLEQSARLDAQQARTDLEIEKTQRQLRAAVRLGAATSRRAFNNIEALATSQRETDARLKTLSEQHRDAMARIDSMLQLWERRWNGNGHEPKK